MTSSARLIFVNRVYWPSEEATAQLLTDLAQGLVTLGWEVHVIAAGIDPRSNEGVIIHRTGGKDRHHGLLSRLANYLGFILGARQRLKALLRPGDIVILKTDPPLLALFLSRLIRSRGAGLVHWVQDIYPEVAQQHSGIWTRLLFTPWRYLRDWTWRLADHCVVVGSDMLALPEKAGVPLAKLSICPNWAPRELELPAVNEDIAALRQEWGLAGKFIVAYSGNLGRVHEFTTMLGAAELLQNEPDIVFLFLGNGARYLEVKNAIAHRKLRNVRMFPAQPRVRLAATLAAADIHLISLRPEFATLVNPSKLAGVLAAGRPAIWIGPHTSANSSLVRQTGCGTAINSGDFNALGSILRYWKQNPATVAQLGLAARSCYHDRFTLTAALQFWDHLFRRISLRRADKL